MPSPGWYPDPAGRPGHIRYWDGQAWSSATSAQPEPAGPPQRRWVPWTVVGIVALVVVTLVVWFAFGSPSRRSILPDLNSASPSVPSWDEQPPEETPPPVVEPQGGTLVDCPDHDTAPHNVYPADGWLHGGGLKVRQIPRWRIDQVRLGWVYDLSAQTDIVESSRLRKWFSMIGVGALNVADGFDSPHVSAFQTMSCFATSRFYDGYTGRTDLRSEAITVNGRPGWHLRSEVRVEMKEFPHIKGDWIDIIVVDTGSPESLGIFIASATIGDHARIDLVESAMESLTTE